MRQRHKPGGYLSLILSGASAERDSDIVTFHCDVVLENSTGSEIQVVSHFGAQLDGIDLVVTDDEGRILAQQPFTYHQSPIYREATRVAIEEGQNLLDPFLPRPRGKRRRQHRASSAGRAAVGEQLSARLLQRYQGSGSA